MTPENIIARRVVRTLRFPVILVPLRISLRLLLLLVAAAAIYFAALSYTPRDRVAFDALQAGDVNALQTIAAWHPDAINENRFSDSLLMDAIHCTSPRRLRLVKAILIAEPKLNEVCGAGARAMPPLVAAVQLGDLDLMAALMQAGADPNYSAVYPGLPLENARRDPRLLKMLLEQGR